jgi:mannose-6-phosphate isomerase-like protein (cupin superfamily)
MEDGYRFARPLSVMQGEYYWHKHDNDDEFFFVLSGRFIIDLEGHSVELLPNQGFTVPKGVLHCTRARKERDLDGRDCRHRANGRRLIRPMKGKSAADGSRWQHLADAPSALPEVGI